MKKTDPGIRIKEYRIRHGFCFKKAALTLRVPPDQKKNEKLDLDSKQKKKKEAGSRDSKSFGSEILLQMVAN